MYPENTEAYRRGVMSYHTELDAACPYSYRSQLSLYCLWKAGYHDARRGLS